MRAPIFAVWGLSTIACSAETQPLLEGDFDAAFAQDAAPVDSGSVSDAGSMEEIGAAIVAAECSFFERCYPEVYHQRFEAPATCIAEGGRGRWRRITAQAAEGRARLDFTGLATCLEALESGGCSRSETFSACDVLVTGTVALGEVCTHADECASGACLGDADSCGVCVPPIPIDGACEPKLLNGCGSTYCYTRIAGTPAKCVPKEVLLDQWCSPTYAVCAEPLVCRRTQPEDGGICRPLLQVGEACPTGPGLGCDPHLARCVGGVCEALVYGDAGDFCDHLTWRCKSLCVSNVCVESSEPGARCGNAAPNCGSSECAWDLVCHPRAAEGEPCDSGLVCQEGFECLGTPQRCTSRPWEFCQ